MIDNFVAYQDNNQSYDNFMLKLCLPKKGEKLYGTVYSVYMYMYGMILNLTTVYTLSNPLTK